MIIKILYRNIGANWVKFTKGGDNPEVPARYHPFYITDDPEGSYQHKSSAQKAKVRVFAGLGVDERGGETPTATGRSCQWTGWRYFNWNKSN
jgi:hypothetical protein